MEFEIDEFAVEAWMLDEADQANPNHAPAWYGDCAGHAQTGEWIPEEGRALTAKRVEPVG